MSTRRAARQPDGLLRRLLPSPLTSLVLAGSWLVMNAPVSLGHLLLAIAFGVAIPLALAPVRGPRARLASPLVALRLTLRVLADIVIANLEVAARILGPRSRIHSGFVYVPLTIRDTHGIAALAGIITLTPGTLSAELSADRRWLLVHALHLQDEQELVATIKQRYEAPLIKIFGSGHENTETEDPC